MAEFQDEHSPAVEAEMDEWMNRASKWSGEAGYAGLGSQDVGEIPTAQAAALAENEEALGLVGSLGLKIVTYEGEEIMIATGNFMKVCLTMKIF